MQCPTCGASLREGANFCGRCGQQVEAATPAGPGGASTRPAQPPPPPVAAPAPSAAPRPSPQPPAKRPSGKLGDWLMAWLRKLGIAQGPLADRPTEIHRTPTAGRPPVTRPLRPIEEAIPLFADRFVTLRHDLRSTFGFYEVYDLNCPHCNTKNEAGHGSQCTQCQQSLPMALLHVSRLQRDLQLEPERILQLSREHPGILDHVSFWQEGEWFVVMLAYPPGWRPLYRATPVQDARQVATWGIQLGETLAYLHGRGFVHYALDTESLEGIVLHEGKAKLSDVTKAWALRSVPEAQAPALLQRDIMFVAKAVHYMATGQTRPLAEESPFQGVFGRAFNNEYAAMGNLLDDLKLIRSGREVGVQVTFSVGQATHAGKVRPANEDSAFVLPMMRLQESQTLATALCVVADGMGGHQAGEQAAKVAYMTVAADINAQLIMPALEGEVTRKLYSSPGEILKEAVERANYKVHQIAERQKTDMGTTVTAVLLEGPRAYVVNVGDSRTYRLRNGKLEQLTEDHSLVARLVQAGTISADEIYTHPRRNEIYRYLGQKATVEVDLLTTDLKKGDQLLLCSDGLWEMVRDPQIQEILAAAPSPQGACDTLVRTAFNAGGEDNITVVVIKVE
jgi:serine/threonine protein phosphatase PrpC